MANIQALKDLPLTTRLTIENNLNCSITGNYANAMGVNSNAKHDYSYVWNGNDAIESYPSQGKGTFNISPINGTDGLFINDKTLYARLEKIIDLILDILEVNEDEPEYELAERVKDFCG